MTSRTRSISASSSTVTSTTPSTADRGHAGAGQSGDQLVGVAADVDRHQPGALQQRVGVAGHDQPAGVDHHHVVAHLLHVVEQVGGHQHRDAERAEAGDEGEHLLAAERVEPGGRLVEQHELRVADERLGELGALAHAGGEAADRAEAGLVEADQIEDVRRPLARGPGRQAAQLAERGRRRRPRSGRAAGSRARACSRAGRARRSGPWRRRCRTPRRGPRSGGPGRAACGTASSCRRRWPRRARCAPPAPRASGRRARSPPDTLGEPGEAEERAGTHTAESARCTRTPLHEELKFLVKGGVARGHLRTMPTAMAVNITVCALCTTMPIHALRYRWTVGEMNESNRVVASPTARAGGRARRARRWRASRSDRSVPHPRQQVAAEEQLLAEHRVEHAQHDHHAEPHPRAAQEALARSRTAMISPKSRLSG